MLSSAAVADTVSYEFTIGAREVNFTGTSVTALAIDNQIPAPTIRASVGDTLRVTFHNSLQEISTVHWHGILLPAGQDGVAHLNTMPIAAGASFTFEFPIIHSGTFWYHSHTDMQIQRGLFGAVVLSDPARETELQEEVVVFSDWTDDRVSNVLNNLKSSDDYYSFDRNTVQSWNRVLANGNQAVRNRFASSLSRMGPMDLADVNYDAFLVNGSIEYRLATADIASSEMKLRLVNGSTSSYFDVEYAGGPMTVIAADGQDIVPIMVQRLRMSTAETYDVLVPIDPDIAYELRATSIDGTGYSSLLVGNGERVAAPDIPAPNLYLMEHGGMDIATMDMATMDMGGDTQHGPGDMAPDAQAPMLHQHPQAGDNNAHADHDMTQTDQMGDGGRVIPHLTGYDDL
ncbi:MAG: multicopper oxidase domain-containing protein, partial [Gammaproteobacteria bacterium]